jgi:large subunit ribosomal protein L29
MKASEIRTLTAAEIEAKIVELKEELFNLKFQQALGSLENPARITEVKRTIARMKTILTEGSYSKEKKEVKKAKKAAPKKEAAKAEEVVEAKEEAPKAAPKKRTTKKAAEETATEEAPKPKRTRAKKTTSSDAE